MPGVDPTTPACDEALLPAKGDFETSIDPIEVAETASDQGLGGQWLCHCPPLPISSEPHQAAINGQRLPGDEARIFAGKECDGACDVRGFA